MDFTESTSAIIRVGAGRGFVIEGVRGRLVITAAHCLPELPPAMSFSLLEERTYRNLLGGLKSSHPLRPSAYSSIPSRTSPS